MDVVNEEEDDGVRCYVLVNRLGDVGLDYGYDGDYEDGDFEDIDKVEVEDQSICGSVYQWL